MPKVNITLNDDIWKWWKENRWINLSGLLEKELWRLRRMEEIHHGAQDVGLGNCPKCGSSQLEFIDGVSYKCKKCGKIV
jgi:tRNA(Ile2) C34 agmatinyltransferase TiaS